MERKVIYIADLDMDIDDIIAVEYLYQKELLKGIVPDPIPATFEGAQRIDQFIKKMNIPVYKQIPNNTRIVFCGGGLTKTAEYLEEGYLQLLVMNGGFAGDNIVKMPLYKFKGQTAVRTFNFNIDVEAADRVLRSNHIQNILLVGKNVCHSPLNTPEGVWKCDPEIMQLFSRHNIKSYKRQHDLLACYEGLVFAGMTEEASMLEYQTVRPFNTGLNGTMTKWGSLLIWESSPYRPVIAAVAWRRSKKKAGKNDG